MFASSGMMYFALQGAMAARGWLAKESNAGLGGVMFGFGIAMVLTSFPGGVLADRLPKRTIMAISYVILAASSLWLAVQMDLGELDYWMVVAASALQGMAFAIMAPARMAFTAEVVPRSLLPNAVALGQLNLNLMKIVGPMIAGWVIGISDSNGPMWLYYAASGLTLMALALLTRLPAGNPSPDKEVHRPFVEFKEGVRYVADHPELRVIVSTSLIIVMFGFPFVTFMPRVATVLLDRGAEVFGLLTAAQGLGAFVAAYFVAKRISLDTGWALQFVGGFSFGASLLAMAFAPNLIVALFVVGLLGATNAGFQIANNSLALMIAKPEYHGRVQSFLLLSFGAFGIAAWPLGLLADALGLRATFAIMACIVMTTSLTAWSMRPRTLATP